MRTRCLPLSSRVTDSPRGGKALQQQHDRPLVALKDRLVDLEDVEVDCRL